MTTIADIERRIAAIEGRAVTEEKVRQIVETNIPTIVAQNAEPLRQAARDATREILSGLTQ